MSPDKQIIRLALSEGLLDSASEKGPLSLVFSSRTLESYFPKLCQDLPAEAESSAQAPKSTRGISSQGKMPQAISRSKSGTAR
jgi:hypothetical protein